jgi:O-antigen/teichoic acid export membrane protein
MNESHSNPIRRLLGTSAIYSLGTVLSRVGALLLLPLYTHALNLEEYGTLELIYAVSSVASTLIGAGLAHTALRFYFDESEQNRGRVITTAYALTVVSGIAVSLACIPFADLIGRVLLGSDGTHRLIELMFAILVLELCNEVSFAYCRVREWALLYVALGLAKLLMQVAASIWFVAMLDLGVTGVLLGNLVSVGLVWLVLTFVVLRHCGLAIDWAAVMPMYRYSVPLAMRSLVSVVGGNVDRLLLRTFVSVEAVAIYGLGQKFAQILRFAVVEPFQLGYGPFRFAVAKRDDAKEVQRRVTVIFAVAGSLAALLLVAVTPAVIQLMSPAEYWSAAEVASIAVIGAIASGLAYCFETGLLIQKSTGTLLKLSFVNFAINTALQAALVPAFGIMGATIGASLAVVAYAAIVHWSSNKVYPLTYLRREDILLLVIASAGLVLMTLVSQWTWTHQIGVALGISAAFVAAAWLLHGEIRTMTQSALAHLRGRAAT